MARTAVLGFPRIGPDRELKFALERYWGGESDSVALEQTARQMRAERLAAGQQAGIDVLPIGDFALYDHLLDVAELVGIVAPRHGGPAAAGELDAHFLACRGGAGVPPLEMTKWFDTNYHYLVPELAPQQHFALSERRLRKWLDHLAQARDSGVQGARPVLVGPFSLLLLSKNPAGPGADPLALLPSLVAVYRDALARFAKAGAGEVQLDEPCLVLDQSATALDAFAQAYGELLSDAPLSVCLATYFGELDDPTLARIRAMPLGELHVDLVRAPDRLDAVLAALPEGARLSAGVVDGRNVWITDVDRALALLDRAAKVIGSDRLTIAPSCSLLHVPYDATREQRLDPELRSWLAFADQKLDELKVLAHALDVSGAERDALLASARGALRSRAASPRTHDPAVRARIAALRPTDRERSKPRSERLRIQGQMLGLPELPTTTIGSFPQTEEIRSARRRRRAGELTDQQYVDAMHAQIQSVVREQEALGLDVLVHGEPERNDMVEYFGEQLEGFAFSSLGWVQSYGSRAVKPPILYGDVSRPRPMTVAWWQYAQSLTERPMKGMLTGPITILQWSFVRDDQPRSETCRQIALAIRDEVVDLQAAGAKIIQIDEAALREGLPLRAADRGEYISYAVECFRLVAAPAAPETQIHTHMCYSEFSDMLAPIAELDADVISIEASRSDMELLDAFRDFDYPGEIGPGVYDIHSPRVPPSAEIATLLTQAQARIPRERLWVNPDCGLKTRGWEETRASLRNMVEAARALRSA